jgi:hypothetical protein
VRLPDKRSSTALAAGILGVGVLMGIAVGPVAAGSRLPSVRQIIAVVSGTPQTQPASSAPSGANSSSASAANTSSGTVDNSSASSGVATTDTSASSVSTDTTSTTTSTDTTTTDTSTTDTSTTDTSTTDTTTGASATRPPKLTLQGVVAAVDSPAQSFALVDRHGHLLAVHAYATTKVGRTVKTDKRKLANGTLEATTVNELKRASATKVTLDGVVTFVDSAHNRYTLSDHGASILIAAKVPAKPASAAPASAAPASAAPASAAPASAAPASAAPTTAGPASSVIDSIVQALTGKGATPPYAPPAATSPLPIVGHRVHVELALPAAPSASAPTGLDELSRTDRGPAKPPLELAGLISAIDPTAHKLTISADGPATIGGGMIALTAPSTIDLKKFFVNNPVLANATVAADGTYTLTGIASDNGAIGADDRNHTFGDFKPQARHARNAKAARSRRESASQTRH